MNNCGSCGAPIIWGITGSGGRMPLDPVPVVGGNVEFRDGVAHVVKPEPGVARYRAHFATCPNAAKHRRGRK